jgi:hypothetical protein
MLSGKLRKGGADMIHQVLSYTAAIAGIISAALWWRAATLVIKKGDPRAASDIFIGGEAVKTTARRPSTMLGPLLRPAYLLR